VNIWLEERHYLFLPVAEATTAPVDPLREYKFYACRWWVAHPDKGLAFHNIVSHRGRRQVAGLGAPQCNADKRVARKVWPAAYPWPSELVFLEQVWVPAAYDEEED